MATRVPARLSRKEGRRFGLTMASAFTVLTAVLEWRDRETGVLVTLTLAAFFLLAALLAPTRLTPIERAWMALARAISKVTTPIFMGAVYFLTFVPIGLLMRLLGRNPIAQGSAGDSFWIDVSGDPQRPDHMQRQF